MLARTVTHALVGLDARRVDVEAHIEGGVPGFAIAGLADRACQEAKHRVRSGISSAELDWPGTSSRITVNLAPAELRKEGSGFDLPIALALLAASRQVPPEALGGHAAVGELGARRDAAAGRRRPGGGRGRSPVGTDAAALRGGLRSRGVARRDRARSRAPPGGGGRLPAGRVAAASARRASGGCKRSRPARTRSRGCPRAGTRPSRARARGCGRPQPAPRGAAGDGEDDARAAPARDPAAASAGRGARGHAHPLGRGAAPCRGGRS